MYKKITSQIAILGQRIDPDNSRKLKILVLGLIFTGLLEFVTLAMLLPFFDALLDESGTNKLASTGVGRVLLFLGIDRISLFIVLSILLIASLIVYGVLRTYLVKYQTNLVHNIGHELSLAGMRSILSQNYSWHVNKDSSELIAINQNMLVVIGGFLTPLLQLGVSSILGLFIFISMMLVLGKEVIVIFLIISLIYVVISAIFHKRIATISEALRFSQPNRIRSIQQSLGNIKEIILTNNRADYIEVFAKADREFMRDRADLIFFSVAPRYVIETVIFVLLIGSALFIGTSADKLIATLPLIATLAIATMRLLPLCQQIYSSFLAVKGSQGMVSQLVELVELDVIDPKIGQGLVIDFQQELSITNITYKYEAEEKASINKLNLNINKGDFVGIFGSSGVGKTTFINIVMGLLEVQSGQFLVDGKLLTRTNMQAWRNNITHVPQDVYLFDDTIAYNITLQKRDSDIDVNRLHKAIIDAELSQFIADQERGLESKIGENGTKVSGGQRQRIAIARALYKKAHILILDEATSALDTQTETRIMSNILGREEDITILAIAHRLSTLERCNLSVEFLRDSKPVILRNNEVVA
jgi:ABC-type multidrug transport system fused ATPase/permease subunit